MKTILVLWLTATFKYSENLRIKSNFVNYVISFHALHLWFIQSPRCSFMYFLLLRLKHKLRQKKVIDIMLFNLERKINSVINFIEQKTINFHLIYLAKEFYDKRLYVIYRCQACLLFLLKLFYFSNILSFLYTFILFNYFLENM